MKNFNNKGLLLVSGLVATVSTTTLLGQGKSTERPNILIIFTDDQGYADLGCFGSQTNKTPVMDNFYREGTSFSNFYALPMKRDRACSVLLSGRGI